jgi:hypothetical protein
VITREALDAKCDSWEMVDATRVSHGKNERNPTIYIELKDANLNVTNLHW